MSITGKGLSAIGRLAAIAALAAAFLFGLAGVVYMSLQGSEVTVPEITGKDLGDSEKELAQLGLKIKKRADRVSAEAPNTGIEQLPKPGETVKTGQWILVVTSRGGGQEDETPASLKNTNEEEETEKIEEMISDKPKKPKANSNTNRKKADTARDVTGNSAGSSNTDTAGANSNKKDPAANNDSSDKSNKTTQLP
ncbi:MAG: PASTA domain-containing protein, partial [Pyrinomonadaceae bacterium]